MREQCLEGPPGPWPRPVYVQSVCYPSVQADYTCISMCWQTVHNYTVRATVKHCCILQSHINGNRQGSTNISSL